MNAIQSERVSPKSFIGFEYKNINAPRDLASVYMDCYPYFGWEVEDSSYNSSINRVSLTFKRDRKMKNKPEINKLQRKFEDSMDAIADLEGSKGTKASIVALIVGILGTAFMAGSVFSVVGGNIIACIILAIPGFVGWALGYILYRSLYRKRSLEVAREKEREFDNLYATCEQAQQLLA